MNTPILNIGEIFAYNTTRFVRVILRENTLVCGCTCNFGELEKCSSNEILPYTKF